MSRETIRRVMRRHHNEFRFCFQRSLQTNPDLEGRVTTRFVISPNGAVAAATIQSSSLRHAETESCVRDVVRRVTFPAAELGGAVSVTYPFSFTSPPR
ncbi:MAG: AgmX/PglI C-terminal domain-containing protein [Myxococcota bacterium]